MKRILSSVLLLSLALPVLAANETEIQQLEQRLIKVFDGKPDSITPIPVEGIYEIAIAGQIFYVTADGNHLFRGDLIDLRDRSNLTENSRSKQRLAMINEVDEGEMIRYAANGEERHVITVFTDIDCGYCRKLHHGMKEMNDLGITVRYMAFPRSAVGSPSYNKSVSVWCAEDRQTAMDDAKLHDKVGSDSCENSPVGRHKALGKQLGVTGTPSILLANGSLLPGYLPPKKLLETIEDRL